jgi:molybdopterin-guanine dinucleotide biosynthesis protein A
MNPPSPSLYGLILAGGASSRMGRDKATLQYHGRSQLEWAFELLDSVCEKTFVSVRPDQSNEITRVKLPQIVDLQPGIGPIAGISAALEAHPDKAWLVLACDLPFLSLDTLDNLIAHRDSAKIATAYRSSHDGLPEPLCAIWEPTARETVNKWIAMGKQCPRKILISSDTALLDPIDSHALDNINTPDEFNSAQIKLA